ncbi:MAG: 30S ribosomal protein S1 [Coxiellaceae bacterium]|nr:30S ribosomal protein S1 [Coxiellaceae bacterium]
MIENFSDLFEQSVSSLDMRPGTLVKATIVDVRPDRITVNAGLKSDAVISSDEFRGRELPQVGDDIEVVIVNVENGFGDTRLSYEKAVRARVWAELEKVHEDGEIVMGTIIERVKGGFTVDVKTIKAFLPGSLVDVKPVRDLAYLEGKELEFKVIKMDQKRNNIVVSRRAVMEAETSAERSARLEQLQEGQEVMGVVKNITDYGAFVDLGGVDGLLHITDIAWKRVKHPSEMISVGQELKVKILKFDREKNRVSLGLKQLGDDPWLNIARRYQTNSRVFGKVTNIADYGCFVELEEGVEGLVHMSELDWTNKNIHPSKVVQPGDEIEVMVLEVDSDRRRISLGIKQCKQNPWQEFADKFQEGDKVSGHIRSMTDFGVFIGLNGDIDGLIHLSDLSWSESGEDVVRTLNKGQEIEAVILSIDAERERISLGVKQLETDPLAEYLTAQGEGAVITAKVKEIHEKHAVFSLNDDMDAVMRIADYSIEHTDSLSDVLTVGEEVDVKLMFIDKKAHQLVVSRKALLEGKTSGGSSAPQKPVVPTKTTLGDLLKEQMNNKDS